MRILPIIAILKKARMNPEIVRIRGALQPAKPVVRRIQSKIPPRMKKVKQVRLMKLQEETL